MLINKTEIALQNTRNPVDYFLMKYINPDVYSATSLYEIINGFQENPPRKKAFLMNNRLALIDTHTTEFRLHPYLLNRSSTDFLPYTQDDNAYHSALFNGEGIPFFLLRYNDLVVGATWNESVERFRQQTYRLGISTTQFTKVPKSRLGYWQYDVDTAFLFVHNLGSYNIKVKEKNELKILSPQLT